MLIQHSAAPTGPLRVVRTLESVQTRRALAAAVDDGDRAAAAAVFRALSTTKRLAVFGALREPLTVPALRVMTGVLDPERDLAVLRDAGLVEQLPGLAPRQWQQVPGAAEQVGSLLAR